MRAEAIREIVFHADPVLEREDRRGFVQHRRAEARDEIVAGGFQRDDHQVDFRHRDQIAIYVEFLRRDVKVASPAFDG